MNAGQLLTKINYFLKGTDDDAPIFDSADGIYWLSIANSKKDELYRDIGKSWSNAYEDRELGTIAAGASPSFDLDSDFLAPSNHAYVLLANGQRIYYDVIKPEEVNVRCRQVYISGQFPETLTFTDTILSSDQIIGGTLQLPAYWLPKDMTVAASKVPVPDANWLAMATAAEIAFNDITYEDKYADLVGKANNLYHLMARKNRRGTYDNPRVTPTKVRRIPGFRR